MALKTPPPLGAAPSTSKYSLQQTVLTAVIAISFFFVSYLSLRVLWRPQILNLISQASTSGVLGEGAEVHENFTIDRQQETYNSNDKTDGPKAIPAPMQKLLSDLQAATEAALAQSDEGSPFQYTEQENEEWKRKNPCRARLELPPLFARKGSKDLQRNFEWEAVLDAYSALHRACTRNIENLGDYFFNKSSVPNCRFVTGGTIYGLGNKITHAASVVLYGILTQRVVLFYDSISVPVVMCEPFDGSSWKLPSSLQYLNERNSTSEHYDAGSITNSSTFLTWMDRRGMQGKYENQAQTMFYHVEMDDGWQPVDRFFCDEEQRILSDVRWMSMTGCLYFLPKLFAVPAFRPTLEALFPDRKALTHVLRSVFLPYNVAWDRIKRNDDIFFRRAHKRVGVQVRYRSGADEYVKLRDLVNNHTIQCLSENDILPDVSDVDLYDPRNSMFAEKHERAPGIKQVLITSLFTDLYEILQDRYLRRPTVTGENVGFVQLTHDQQQRWGLEVDTQALVEIVLLSLADEILVTPLSTFGGVAQAYGNVKPWIVEHRGGGFDNEGNDRDRPSCVRASSVEMCYQGASDFMSCPSDPTVHNRTVYELVPYIEKCVAADSANGLILITD